VGRPVGSLIGGNGIAGRRPDLFAFCALAAHAAFALALRATAWPEVTTTGYLWSRGLMMYRDIKEQHAPGLMGLLALAFLVFGPGAALIRLFSTVPPLVAHVFLLRETRASPTAVRALASAFFVVCFYVSDGNAVWATVVMAALALPIASLLTRRRMVAAGLLIGTAILLKQTAAYLLILAVLVLLAGKRRRDAAVLLLAGCVPYWAVVGVFGLFGAAGDMLRWTIGVPFTIRYERSFVLPGAVSLAMVLAAFLPLAVEAILEGPGERGTSAKWLLLVATGLALIGYPRFDMMQTVGAVPCLAAGAARLMRRGPPRLSRAAILFVATFTLARGVLLMSWATLDGRILFWNDEPAFNSLIEELRRFPKTTVVHSRLWGNVLPRTELLPPGRIFVHPWLVWFFPVDRIGERVAAAARAPGTVIVDYREAIPGRRVGPYAIFTVPPGAGPGGPEGARPPPTPSRP
jgi:hypothetical protein